MRNNFLLKTLAVCLLAVNLVSCKKDKDEPAPDPANVVVDATGLKVVMAWTMGDGSNPSTSADLDLYLYKTGGGIKEPTMYFSDDMATSSETITIPSSLADGEYTLAIDYFEVQANGKSGFNFSGATANSTDTYAISDLGFLLSDESTEKDKVKIVKAGNKFTITKL